MNKLQTFLEEHKLKAEIVAFKEEVRTAADAAERLGTEEEKIAKTVLFVDEDSKLIAVIIQGKKKVSSNKLKKLLNIKRARVASREEVLEKTGYEAGAVPPIGFKAIFILDKGVEGEVYTGGGTTSTLLKIHTAEIIKINKPLIADVAE